MSQTGKTEYAGGWKNHELRGKALLRSVASKRICGICKNTIPVELITCRSCDKKVKIT